VKVIILGAGVIGTTTAWYLSRAGHDVAVIDRQRAPALETSYANGALLTPGMADPWAAPGIAGIIWKYLGREDAPFLLRLHALPGLLGWGRQFLANSSAAKWRKNTESVFALAANSQALLETLSPHLGLRYDRNDQGNLRVYRDQVSLKAADSDADIYRSLGFPVTLLDAAGCVTLEPALGPIAGTLAGGLHYLGDRAGDCFAFTQALAAAAEKRGARFQFDTKIIGLRRDADTMQAVVTDRGEITGDCYVLACGSYSPALARPLDLKLPVYPVKGYSATLNIDGWNDAPRLPIVNYDRKMVVIRLGERIRLAGTAEFAGFDLSPNPARGRLLLDAFRDLFPNYPGGDEVEHWCGLRPMCPDGRPIIGRSRYRNLFLNTGHGPLGWTLACGSGKAVADLVSGQQPDLDCAPFALARFQPGTAQQSRVVWRSQSVRKRQ
jgi:D-amino-acid dehydrogenase